MPQTWQHSVASVSVHVDSWSAGPRAALISGHFRSYLDPEYLSICSFLSAIEVRMVFTTPLPAHGTTGKTQKKDPEVRSSMLGKVKLSILGGGVWVIVTL